MMKTTYSTPKKHSLPGKAWPKQLITPCLLLLLVTTSHATIWRVNSNREVIGANFYSLADAHSAASAGDTLHLEASLFGYGSLTLTKPLTLIGPGYFLIENQADTTRADSLNAQLNNLIVNSGAKGAVIMGLEIVGTTTIRADSVSILRNKLVRITVEGRENTVIAQNYLKEDNSGYGVLVLSGSCRNTRIFNNIIIAGYFLWGCISTNTNAILTYIQNNVLYGKSTVYNAFVNNNILLQYGSFLNNLDYPNSYYNNMSDQSDFGTINGNLANVSMSTVFTASTQSPDKYYELKPGSPAIGAGLFGEDMGPFGGDDPYRLSGIVPLPSIFNVEITETGSPVMQLDVTFKAKSNR